MRRNSLVAALLVAVCGALVSADGGDLTVTPIARDGQLLVSFELNEGLGPDVRDAIQSGLATSYAYEIGVKRGPSWFDRTIASVSVTASVRFDNLTRRYQMSRAFDGRLEDARPTEDQDTVQRWMTRFERVPVSTTAALEANGEYYVSVRALAHPRVSWFVWPWERGSVGNAKFTFIP